METAPVHKVVFFNGPPGSGKDTAADLCVKVFNARKYAMKAPIRDAIRGFLDIDDLRDYNAFFENRDAKDTKSVVTLGDTPREVLISFSEDWAKRRYGEDVFGRLAVRRLSGATGVNLTAVSDAGFTAELALIVRRFGAENCYLVRLYRETCSFVSDSRGYVDPAVLGVRYVDIHNKFDLETFRMQITAVVRKALDL